MAILLIAFSFISTLIIFCWVEPNSYGYIRAAFLKSSIIYGVLIALLTEGLSIQQSLEFTSVATFWSLILALNITWLILLLHQRLSKTGSKQEFSLNFQQLDNSSQIAVVTIVSILGISLVTALIAPPNNWDSMTYHMSRVMHWIQNCTVAHYPTNNLRQLSFPAEAEYIIAQLQLLAGSDRFANCVQWLAFLGSIIGTSLIINSLAGAQAEWIGSLACASIPMAIMQSMTTQTDLTVAFWLICFAYFTFRTDTYTKVDLFWLSASLDLAILTKPTAFFFGFTLSVILAFRVFKSVFRTYGKLLVTSIKTAGIGIFILFSSLTLSVPSYWRNYQTFGTILGTEGGTRNAMLGLPQLISNFLKYITLNLPIPGFLQLVDLIHANILKVEINDPDLNFSTTTLTTGTLLRTLTPHEDFVGSPIHLVLSFLTLIALISTFLKSHPSSNKAIKPLLILLLANLGGFLILCFLLKWQPWGNRLILPLFVLNSPAIAYYLTYLLPEQSKRLLILLLALIAVLYSLTPLRHPLIALPIVFPEQAKEQSQSILLLERQDIYFSGAKKDLKAAYQNAVKLVSSYPCKFVGLDLEGDDWEYPLWVLFARNIQQPFYIKNINVHNESQKLQPEFPDSLLCAVISTTNIEPPQLPKAKDVRWRLVAPLFSNVKVYVK
jgi:hypothetical protein